MTQETEIRLDKFVPRPYQLPICSAAENKDFRKLLYVLPRRAGKDIVAWNLMIRAALKAVGIYFYCLPTFKQARMVIMDSITNDGQRFLDFIPKELIASVNQQEMKIRLRNGSIIQLTGSDSYDTSLVGSNARMIVFSEYGTSDSNAYTLAARPILNANGGTVIILGTPRGKNHFYEMYQIAKNSPDWFCYFQTLDDTQHINADDIRKEIESGEISEDLALQEYWCFPPDAKVLTPTSSKNICDIKINDLVISHTGRPRKVLNTMVRQYEGEFIVIKSRGSSQDIKCTPEHPIRVYHRTTQSYSWKKASEITIDDLLVFPKKNLGDKKIVSYEMAMLIAWYITEGSSFNNGLQFSLGDDAEVERVTSLLEALGHSWKRYQTTCIDIVVNSVHLIDFFASACGSGAENKKIPFDLIIGHEKEFFFELMRGDGCVSVSEKQSRYVYTTISETLAYQFQMLANSLDLGLAAGISMRDSYEGMIEGRTVNCRQSYSIQIHIPKTERDFWMVRAKNNVCAALVSISKEYYSGPVHNISVQYDESYLIYGRSVHNCSWELGVEGSYYAKYIDKMRLNGRIGDVPWDPALKVHTAWDIGWNDSTCIIFYQVKGSVVRIIDCYESNFKPIEHYCKLVQSKSYLYGKHFVGHDIMVHEQGSGLTRYDMYKNLGVKFEQRDGKSATPSVSIEDGIEALRSLFARMYIDETNCKQLIKCLENYHQEYDNKRKVYKGIPLHDWSSHMADAGRYLALTCDRVMPNTSAADWEKHRRDAYGTQSNLPPVFRDDLPRY